MSPKLASVQYISVLSPPLLTLLLGVVLYQREQRRERRGVVLAVVSLLDTLRAVELAGLHLVQGWGEGQRR